LKFEEIVMSSMISETTPLGVDKVSRYGWVIKDEPGRLVMIHKEMLNIPDEYQRDLITSKVKEITKNWSWIGAGVIVVAERDGKFWVIDGQHRVAGAWRRSDITQLPCIVFKTKDVKTEAKAFLDINTQRKPVSSIGKFKAMLAAGDEGAIIANETFELLGIKPKSTASKARELKSVAWSVRRAKEDAARFKKVMRIAADISSDMPIKEILLEGLWYIDERIDGGIEQKRFVKRLHAIGAQGLIDAAKKASAYFVRGGAKIWAHGMLNAINKGLRNKFEVSGIDTI